MISSGEVVRALLGCWMLLRNQSRGMQQFDLSADGFWRSFLVVLLLIPFSIVNSFVEKRFLLQEAAVFWDGTSETAFWFSQFLGLGLDWIALPVILAFLAPPLGLSTRYGAYIVVRNWSSLAIALPYLAIALLYLLGLIQPGIMVLLHFGMLAAVVWYHFLIVRIALGAGINMTIAIIVFDLLLSLLISEIAGRIWIA